MKSNSKNSPEAATQEVKETLCTVITAWTTASSNNKKQSQTINICLVLRWTCWNHDNLYNFCKIRIAHRNFDNSMYVWSVSVKIMISHLDLTKATCSRFCKTRIVHCNFDKPTTIPNTCFYFLELLQKLNEFMNKKKQDRLITNRWWFCLVNHLQLGLKYQWIVFEEGPWLCSLMFLEEVSHLFYLSKNWWVCSNGNMTGEVMLSNESEVGEIINARERVFVMPLHFLKESTLILNFSCPN